MEIQQLRHFLAAVRYGNIAAAADKLHITQSGLSRSIKNLETTLGLQLLKRNPRGVEPTPFGANLIPRAQAILNERDRAVEELNAVRKAQSGIVKVGVTLNFTHYLAPETIAQYVSERKGVNVVVETGAFPDLIESLQLAEVDFVFGLIGGHPDKSHLKIEYLFDSHSAVLCRPSHPLAGLRKVGPAQIAEAGWAMLNGASFQAAFAEYFMVRNLPLPRQILRTNSIAFLKRSVACLDVLTILPEPLVQAELAERSLVKLPVDTPAGVASVGIVTREDEILTPAVLGLIEVFRSLTASAVRKKLKALA
jgi:DNA-binding transcriptional LysR family regulator